MLTHEFGRLVADVEMHVIEAEALDLVVDGAGDDVARGQLHPLVEFGHEALAGLRPRLGRQLQDAALASHRLGNEEVLDVEVVEASRVELHEFHVRHPAPRAPGHGNAVAGRAAGRGAEQVGAPGAAGGQDRRPGGQRLDMPGPGIQRIDAPDRLPSFGRDGVAIADEVDGNHVLAQRDVGVRTRRLQQRGLHRPAGGVVDVDDAAVRMPALPRQVKRTLFGIERHAEVDQPLDRLRRMFDDVFDRFDPIEPRAGDHRVADVILERVARIQHRRDAALRPGGGPGIERALRGYEHFRAFGQHQCGGQPRGTRTDDDDIKPLRHELATSPAHPCVARMTARAARSCPCHRWAIPTSAAFPSCGPSKKSTDQRPALP